jgi:hypothetical protein
MSLLGKKWQAAPEMARREGHPIILKCPASGSIGETAYWSLLLQQLEPLLVQLITLINEGLLGVFSL